MARHAPVMMNAPALCAKAVAAALITALPVIQVPIVADIKAALTEPVRIKLGGRNENIRKNAVHYRFCYLDGVNCRRGRHVNTRTTGADSYGDTISRT